MKKSSDWYISARLAAKQNKPTKKKKAVVVCQFFKEVLTDTEIVLETEKLMRFL